MSETAQAEPVLGEEGLALDEIRRVLYGKLDRGGVRCSDSVRGVVAVLAPAVAALVGAAEQWGAENALCLHSDGPAPVGGEYRCALRRGHVIPAGHHFEVWSR